MLDRCFDRHGARADRTWETLERHRCQFLISILLFMLLLYNFARLWNLLFIVPSFFIPQLYSILIIKFCARVVLRLLEGFLACEVIGCSDGQNLILAWVLADNFFLEYLQYFYFFCLHQNRVRFIKVDLNFIGHTENLALRAYELECTGVTSWDLKSERQLILTLGHFFSSELKKPLIKFKKQKSIFLDLFAN